MPRKGKGKQISPLSRASQEWWESLSEEDKKDPAVIVAREGYFFDKAIIEQERQRYEETKNPLHIWSVYKTCREFKPPIPPEVAEAYEWALEYMDGVADKLLCVRSDPDTPYHGIGINAEYKPEWLEYALGMRPTAEGPKEAGGGKQHFADKRDFITKKRFVDLAIALRGKHEGMGIDEACRSAVVKMVGIGIFPVAKAKEEFLNEIKICLAPSKCIDKPRRSKDEATEEAANQIGRKYGETVKGWYKQWPFQDTTS